MRKTIIGLMAVFVAALFPSLCIGAGTVTETWTYPTGDQPKEIRILTITWTADSSDGSVPSLVLTQSINGYIFLVEVATGSTAPTDLYSIVLRTSVGNDTIDIMGGTLAGLTSSGGETKIPKVDTSSNIYGSRYISTPVTFILTNNSVNSASGALKVYITR